MIEQLETAIGSVGVKDYVALLAHFAFAHGRVHAFNGRTYVSAPLPKTWANLQFTAPAKQFLEAVRTAGAEHLSIDPDVEAGRVTVRGARGFIARLPCGEAKLYPIDLPLYAETRDAVGKPRAVPRGLLPLLLSLRPIISDDASRPWANAVRVENDVAAVTNNIIVVTAPLKFPFPCTLPVFLLDELLRIDLQPVTAVQLQGGGVTLHLPDGIIVRSVTVHGDWPKSPIEILDVMHKGAKCKGMPAEEIAEAVSAVLPFAQDLAAPVIELEGEEVRVRGAESLGARLQVRGMRAQAKCAFRAEPLKLCLALATAWDLSNPHRVPFVGLNGVRGGIAGMMT